MGRSGERQRTLGRVSSDSSLTLEKELNWPRFQIAHWSNGNNNDNDNYKMTLGWVFREIIYVKSSHINFFV